MRNFRYFIVNSSRCCRADARSPIIRGSRNWTNIMRSQRQIFTLIAAAGSAGAFLHHPSASHHHAAASSSSLIAEPFGDGRAVTSLGVGIRSIRSPYWQVFNRAEAPAQNGVGHVIDRDYTVASVLLCVGLWLGLFGPSAYTHQSRFVCALRSKLRWATVTNLVHLRRIPIHRRTRRGVPLMVWVFRGHADDENAGRIQ